MKSKWLYNTFIIGFVILYLATALISYCHAIEFFRIGNEGWMAMTLAGVFELGQMVVLSSLLLSDNKKTIIPWLLLIVLTAVQVIGNVFSVFKFISLTDNGAYVYLQKSLIDWWLSGVEQSTIIVIISWIIGALLPIIALFMTSMVSNNIKLRSGDIKPVDTSDDKASHMKYVESDKKSVDEVESDDIHEEKSEMVEDKAEDAEEDVQQEDYDLIDISKLKEGDNVQKDAPYVTDGRDHKKEGYFSADTLYKGF